MISGKMHFETPFSGVGSIATRLSAFNRSFVSCPEVGVGVRFMFVLTFGLVYMIIEILTSVEVSIAVVAPVICNVCFRKIEIHTFRW